MLSCKSSRADRDPGDDEPQQKSDVIADHDDIITKILLRFPVKVLLRFKSVSKRWLSLISNPLFSHIHFRRNPASVSGLFLRNYLSLINKEYDFVSLNENETRIPFRSLSFIDDAIGMSIEQSCNGLLFCSCFGNYYIYNPTTKQHTKLPSLRGGGMVLGIKLAFDPSKSPHYKVVCVRESIEFCERHQIEIYSSETGSWRPSGDPFCSSKGSYSQNSVYWNGAIHWVSMRCTSLYFDIEREILLTMPMPPIPEGWNERRIFYFGESRGHMHLIEIYDRHTTQFDVLEMESNHSNWFVKYRVDLDVLTTAYPEIVFSVLCIVRGQNEEEASSLVLNIHDKVISYNLKDETFKELHDLQPSVIGNSEKYKWCYNVYEYLETLSCI